jgi:hypothetical protein
VHRVIDLAINAIDNPDIALNYGGFHILDSLVLTWPGILLHNRFLEIADKMYELLNKFADHSDECGPIWIFALLEKAVRASHQFGINIPAMVGMLFHVLGTSSSLSWNQASQFSTMIRLSILY